MLNTPPSTGDDLRPHEDFAAGDQFLVGPSSRGALPGTPFVSASMADLLQAGDLDDFGFLESFLLHDATMIPGPISPLTFDDESTAGALLGLSNPGFHSTTPFQSPSGYRRAVEPGYFRFLATSDHDVQEFKRRVDCLCHQQDLLKSFQFPRRSRIVRCIVAYFDHFDAHTPIIQHARFSLSDSHPALVLIMLAFGAMYLAENDFAAAAYEASRLLLEHYPIQPGAQDPSCYDFSPLQAMLLGVQFGAFSGQAAHAQHSQRQLAAVTEMLKNDLPLLDAQRALGDETWERWSFIETFSRLATWSVTLTAILLAYNPTSTYIAPYQLRNVPLPLDEDLWRARSASRWTAVAGRTKLHGELTLSDVADRLVRGDSIPDNISSLGMLSLLGWALTYICTQERSAISIGPAGVVHNEFKANMERVISGWETFCHRRMRADRIIERGFSPLFVDCFPLLASCYYHLYLADELRTLKEIASNGPLLPGALAKLRPLPSVVPLQLTHKAIWYAANSWLVRAKHGIGHFRDTAATNYGGHSLMTAYETGKYNT